MLGCATPNGMKMHKFTTNISKMNPSICRNIIACIAKYYDLYIAYTICSKTPYTPSF